MTILLGNKKGAAVMEPKGFATSLSKPIQVDELLQMMTSILQQCAVNLTSDIIQLYKFAGPTHGFMGELVYQAGKSSTDPRNPYTNQVVTVTPALRLQCAVPSVQQGAVVYLEVADPEGWFLRPAEDRLAVLLVDVAKLLELAAQLPHTPEWRCLQGRWNFEVDLHMPDGSTIARRNPPLEE